MPKHWKKEFTQEPDETVDLHGLRVYEALPLIAEVVADWRPTSGAKIRFITGKGTHSEGGYSPIREGTKLKLSDLGLSWNYAKQNEGGEGALDVIIP